MLVRDRIKEARQNVTRSVQRVQDVRARLKTRRGQVQARLTAIGVDRQELLSGPESDG